MKKRTSTIICALAILCLATSCFVGSTFAKYTSNNSATGSVMNVAKWSFEVGKSADNNITSDTFAFELDSTIRDEDNTVKDKLMAPGTTGKYTFVLNNTSDVDADVIFSLTNALGIVDDAGISTDDPRISASDATFPTLTITVKNGDTPLTADGGYYSVAGIKAGESATISVTWGWAIGDATLDPVNNDTKLGILAASMSGTESLAWVTTIDVTATQVD